METIDVRKIIESRGLDMKEVARQLFPKNKFPENALWRVFRKKGILDADQISKLSLLSGLSVSELFSGGKWKAKSQKGLHVFTNEEFRAELDTDVWTTKLFHNDSLFHEEVMHSHTISLGEYFQKLEAIIENYKSINH